ncbi:dTDP-4-dehydrorhamnose 3,5-epimerase [Candidatus Pelagibacter sp.]|nr:dTDP-4-dehydrorhamnose 3,5-epimerase [Candidatus Pelagibacter sp.]
MKKIKKNKELIIVHNQSYKDKRGYFKEILLEKNIKKKFPFLVMSYSKKNVLRGLHLQMKKSQGKYISVIKGKIFDVAVDLRKNSKKYGKAYAVTLSEKNSKSLFIPAGFAHGFFAMGEENYIIYSCTNYRDSKSEVSIKYNDKRLKIKWPSKKILISKKDLNAMSFDEFENKFIN